MQVDASTAARLLHSLVLIADLCVLTMPVSWRLMLRQDLKQDVSRGRSVVTVTVMFLGQLDTILDSEFQCSDYSGFSLGLCPIGIILLSFSALVPFLEHLCLLFSNFSLA